MVAAITASLIYTSYYFVKALKSIINVLNNLEDASESIKETVKLKVLAAVPALLIALASKLIRKRR